MGQRLLGVEIRIGSAYATMDTLDTQDREILLVNLRGRTNIEQKDRINRSRAGLVLILPYTRQSR